MKRPTCVFIFIILLNSCQLQTNDSNNRLIEFKDRKIDLKPYVEGFPYTRFAPFYDAGKLYYFHQDSTTMMKEISLSGESELSKGILVSDIDFSKRNVWDIRYHKEDNHLYWTGDEINDEVLNIYRLNPQTRTVKKITDAPYIFGWNWDQPKNQIAYIARLGVMEERLGELRILDLETLEETPISTDTPEFRFTWSDPSWQPEGKGVVVSLNKNADRTFGNLVYIDIKSKKWMMITDPDKPRDTAALLDWLNNNEFIYHSNEDGYFNLYRFNIKSKITRQITSFEKDIAYAKIVTIENQKYIFAIINNPIESKIVLINPDDAQIINRQLVDLNINILDYHKNRLLIRSTSATIKFQIDELVISKDKFTFSTIIEIPSELKYKIVHSRNERIEYPTFDIDPETGKPRMLHAFLYHPINPLPPDQQIVMIQSFYGGSNRYSTLTQILTEAGIYVLSPAPRGSYGYGQEFAALNDKDLGGNEIIDIIYAGKYISKQLGVPAEHIGVYGGSHGGYATMRLLTFPGEINGNIAHFDWGFGISRAGFSDIIHFYKSCNIPDWVTLEAGDPATEEVKLKDRSPLYHADKMIGKLLLLHGTNDKRVPVEGSRWMADSLRKYQKDVTLVEFEGQGHGVKGLDNTITRYKAWFEFLDSIN